MADDTNSPAPDNGGETSSNYTPKNYDIAPADQALADSIASFDPVYDIEGPVTSDVPLKVPETLTRDMLPPDMLETVTARLNELPEQSRTAEREQAFIRQALEQNAYALRVYAGPGEGADPYKQEWFLLEHEKHMAHSERVELEAKLLDVHGHRKVVDEVTGAEHFEADYILQGDARTAAEFRLAELKQLSGLLDGSEGKRRLQRALHEAVAQHRERERMVELEDAAHRRADEIVREEEVEERARAYAKFKRTER